MAKSFNNDWFSNANKSFTDISRILMRLDKQGVIPEDMREAIHKHANNNLDTLPWNIAAIASSLAAAVDGNVGLQNEETAQVGWCIAVLAEQVHGWQELEYCFKPANTDVEVKL